MHINDKKVIVPLQSTNMRKNLNILSPDYKYIFNLINHNTLGSFASSNFMPDWDYIARITEKQGVSGLIFTAIKNNCVEKLTPPALLKRLSDAYYFTIAANSKKIKELSGISQLLNSLNIPMIVLKGLYLGPVFYNNIGLRPAGDIDILIKEKHIEEVKNILYNSGYRSNYTKQNRFVNELDMHHHLPAFFKKNITIEIHYKLCNDSVYYKTSMNDIWDRSIAVNLFNIKCLSLCNEDLIIYQCFHLSKHFNAGSFRINHFYDISLIFKNLKNHINWDLLQYLYESIDKKKDYSNILGICQKYFSIKFPPVCNEIFNIQIEKSFENRFIRFIQGKKIKALNIKILPKEIKSIKKNRHKILFVLSLVFPDTKFMQYKYGIESEWLIYLFYPIRIIEAIFKITYSLF